jgi:hypothetical protein
MPEPAPTVAGAFAAKDDERVWFVVAREHPTSLQVDVLAWAVTTDGQLAPVVQSIGDGGPAAFFGLWDHDHATLQERWVYGLPPLPMLPPGATIDCVPVARFDDTVVVFGSVGLGNEVWGPFSAVSEQVVSGLDLVTHDKPFEAEHLGWLLPGPVTDCRVTWGQSMFVEGEPAASVLLEAADSDGGPDSP